MTDKPLKPVLMRKPKNWATLTDAQKRAFAKEMATEMLRTEQRDDAQNTPKD